MYLSLMGLLSLFLHGWFITGRLEKTFSFCQCNLEQQHNILHVLKVQIQILGCGEMVFDESFKLNSESVSKFECLLMTK